MSKITVTTIAGQTSGSDANKVKIESGDTLQVETNATVGGTLAVTGNTSASTIALGGRSFNAGATPLGVNFSSASGSGLHINDTNSGNLGGMMQFYSGSGTGTLRANIQNANNAGVHMCLGTGGSVVFTQTGYVAANALDDYEEGTFDVKLYLGSTLLSTTSNKGRYTKVGNKVHINFASAGGSVQASKGSNTGSLYIKELPFVIDNGYPTGTWRYDGVSLDSGTVNTAPIGRTGVAEIEFQMFSLTTYLGNVQQDNMGGTTTIYDMSLTYFTS